MDGNSIQHTAPVESVPHIDPGKLYYSCLNQVETKVSTHFCAGIVYFFIYSSRAEFHPSVPTCPEMGRKLLLARFKPADVR